MVFSERPPCPGDEDDMEAQKRRCQVGSRAFFGALNPKPNPAFPKAAPLLQVASSTKEALKGEAPWLLPSTPQSRKVSSGCHDDDQVPQHTDGLWGRGSEVCWCSCLGLLTSRLSM